VAGLFSFRQSDNNICLIHIYKQNIRFLLKLLIFDLQRNFLMLIAMVLVAQASQYLLVPARSPISLPACLQQSVWSMSTSAKESLPMSSCGGDQDSSRKKVPGWNVQVKPFRDNARFWHAVWVSADKPLNCKVHNIMRRTKNIFHYQFKKCRKAESQIKKQQLLSAMLDPESDTDIFKEIKKMRNSRSVAANKIDDKTENIENHFSNIYSALYNSVDDYEELLKVDEEIENKINDKSIREVGRVTPELVKEAVKHIKPGKSDPVCDFSSDCLKMHLIVCSFTCPTLSEASSSIVMSALYCFCPPLSQ
jgi:hypothetical protein